MEQAISASTSICTFLNVEFSLETFGPERIAVEKVFHSTTSTHLYPTTGNSEKEEANQSSSSSEDAKKPGEESKLQEISKSLILLKSLHDLVNSYWK